MALQAGLGVGSLAMGGAGMFPGAMPGFMQAWMKPPSWGYNPGAYGGGTSSYG